MDIKIDNRDSLMTWAETKFHDDPTERLKIVNLVAPYAQSEERKHGGANAVRYEVTYREVAGKTIVERVQMVSRAKGKVVWTYA